MLSIFRLLFFKQKTAYEMRISDWSSDVCSSDLVERAIILFPNMQINADQVDTLFRRRNSNAPTTQLVREPGRSSPSCSLNGRGIDLKQHLAEIERQYIAAADRKSTRLKSSH